jgi:Icc-related predicted phosphoesterase
MKILCVSDQLDPLIYTNTIKQRYADVDIILSAGDLPMDYLDFIISTLNKPLYFVLGNHHNNSEGGPEIQYSGAISVETKVRCEDGLIIAGLGGSMRYNKGENQYSDFDMYFRVLKLLPALLFNRVFRGRFLDVLLTHAAPLEIHDKQDRCHMGFKSFLWFMRIFKPKYLIHGHIHLYDFSEVRTTKYFGTTVINAFSHYLIDTGERT